MTTDDKRDSNLVWSLSKQEYILCFFKKIIPQWGLVGQMGGLGNHMEGFGGSRRGFGWSHRGFEESHGGFGRSQVDQI